MSAAHLRMYQQFGALAVLELLTVATCAVAGPRVADDSQMASALRAMTEDVISQWEILEVRTRAPVLIGSRPRPDPQTPFFCIREVIQLGVDPEGRLLSPEGQAEWMNTNAISPTFRMFALSADGSCSIASDRFFRARTRVSSRARRVYRLLDGYGGHRGCRAAFGWCKGRRGSLGTFEGGVRVCASRMFARRRVVDLRIPGALWLSIPR